MKSTSVRGKLNTFHPHIEALERRDVPAGISLTDGLITITGSNDSDMAQVQLVASSPYSAAQIEVTLSNSTGLIAKNTYDPSAVMSVIFKADDGNNFFYNATAIPSKAYGGSGSDIFVGGSGDDWFYGGGGDDHLWGGGGNDWLFGENGNDSLFGGNGNDRLCGGNGMDLLQGGSGDDWLDGGDFFDQDQLWGGSGADVFFDHRINWGSGWYSGWPEFSDFNAAEGDFIVTGYYYFTGSDWWIWSDHYFDGDQWVKSSYNPFSFTRGN